MSDSNRLYEAVHVFVTTHVPNLREEHKITLSEMITGILISHEVRFREIGQKVNYDNRGESLIDKFRGFVRNENISVEDNYAGFLTLIFNSLEDEHITLIMDTTKAGGKCLCLMLSLYLGRGYSEKTGAKPLGS